MKLDNNKEEIHDSVDCDMTSNKATLTIFYSNEGCTYCNDLIKYVDKTIKPKYGKKLNIVKYNVEEDDSAEEKIEITSYIFNEEIYALPYYIIGEDTFVAFNKEKKEELIKAIDKELEKETHMDINRCFNES